MSEKRILSVGQCNADHGSISRLLKSFSAEVVSADSIEEAVSQLRQRRFALVLVNRVFDVTAEAGLDLIRQVKQDVQLAPPPIMLVSNFADAQTEAVAAGAVPGFGKASLQEATTRTRLQEYLG